MTFLITSYDNFKKLYQNTYELSFYLNAYYSYLKELQDFRVHCIIYI